MYCFPALATNLLVATNKLFFFAKNDNCRPRVLVAKNTCIADQKFCWSWKLTFADQQFWSRKVTIGDQTNFGRRMSQLVTKIFGREMCQLATKKFGRQKATFRDQSVLATK